jgi:hypothetical protein
VPAATEEPKVPLSEDITIQAETEQEPVAEQEPVTEPETAEVEAEAETETKEPVVETE